MYKVWSWQGALTMNDRLVPWKNTGEERLKMKKLFGIRYDIKEGKYVPDPTSKTLGYWEKVGSTAKITKYIPPKIEMPKATLQFTTPTLGIVENPPKEEKDE